MNAVKTRAVIVMVLGIGLVGLVGLGWLIAGDPLSQSKWDSIQTGMTKKKVLQIMGKPDSYYGNQLDYSRFMNAGWVEFAFDEHDILIRKNDESVESSLSK